MITVSYNDETLILTPENIDDNNDVMHCISSIEGVYYMGGSWYIPENKADEMNEKIAPLSGRFIIEPSFVNFLKHHKDRIIIKCGPVISHIYGENVPHKEIEDVTKYFWKPAVRQQRYIDKKWDGYITLYKRWERSFPTGLLYLVEQVLKKQDLQYEVQYLYERRPQRQFNWYVDDNIKPDPDQIEAVNAGLKGLRGVLKAPTGFGNVA